MAASPMTPAKDDAETERASRAWWVREVVAILTWAHIVVKLFVFDVDVYLLERWAPAYRGALNYKAFFMLFVVAVGWLLGGRRFPLAVAYVVVYPFTLLFWRLPKLALPYWPFLLALAPAMYRAALTLRATFVLYSFAVLSALAIIRSSEPWLLGGAMATLLFALAVHLGRSVKRAYSDSVFDGLCDLTRRAVHAVGEGKIDKFAAPGAVTSGEPPGVAPADAQGRDPSLLYILRSLADVAAIQVSRVARSRVFDLYLIGALLNTVALTTFAFAFEYAGLHKLDPAAFENALGAGFWSFARFSLSILTRAGSKIEPVSPFAFARCTSPR